MRLYIFLLLTTIGWGTTYAQHSLRPFPQHVRYFSGIIRPNKISRQVLDKTTADFYDQWKLRYIKNVAGKPQSFVWFEGRGGKQCVSEGQGYGMIIVALMAGHDGAARSIYDNLFRYARAHPSRRSKYLMAWAQKNNGLDLDKTTASDGDLDIAYSLLLASKQWGNKGAINYLQQARSMINEIMRCEINPKTWTVLLGAGLDNESGDWFATRTSDFMPAHFKAFWQATGDIRWKKVVDAGYRLCSFMQKTYSPDAGLLPDFIVRLNKTPKPAVPNFLESKYDGQYNYNACRDPWRIGVDFIMNGDARPKYIVAKINRWIRETTDNDTYNLSAGYTLEGNDISNRYFEALSFIAPFGVSAMVDARNQSWLNKVWLYLTSFKINHFDYYDNSIKLLNMIIISGNYWQ